MSSDLIAGIYMYFGIIDMQLKIGGQAKFIFFLISQQKTYESQHGISNNVVCVTSKGSDQPAHMRSLIRAFASGFKYSMGVTLLTKHHLEFLTLKGGCTGWS